jgi:type II secretory ATPase GspE/PulE/Tfp pilus assembly ATPase PilB-like protein
MRLVMQAYPGYNQSDMGGVGVKVISQPTNSLDGKPVDSIWRRIFSQAIRTNATDIHIEPQAGALLVRLRRQGALSTDLTLAAVTAKPLALEIKQMAGLNLKQTKAPQESTFSQVHNHHIYHLNVDTMPLVSGERIVIHIYDPMAQPPELTDLGLWGKSLQAFQNALTSPHGLILISGPNHSGVSTTLASCAAALSSPLNHIASVEENAAYNVSDVNYMTVRPTSGMTWSRVLRMQLKHEPNIVIVGNLPDRETAEITVTAANQQQLFLSGIRADSATAATMQIIRLSGNPLDLAASLRLVCNQRLVPKLCPDCREAYTPDTTLQNNLTKKFHLDKSESLLQLQQFVIEAKYQLMDDRVPITSEWGNGQNSIVKLWRAKDGGCIKCRKSGINGAVGLFEIITVSDVLRQQLAQTLSASASQAGILANRIYSLQLDGLVKALCGLISIDTVPDL